LVVVVQEEGQQSNDRPESYKLFAAILRLMNLEVNVKKRDDNVSSSQPKLLQRALSVAVAGQVSRREHLG